MIILSAVLVLLVLFIRRMRIRMQNKCLSRKYRDAKYAFVTGCTGGLGREITRQLIEHHGFSVIGAGRNGKRLQELRNSYGTKFLPFEHDFSQNGLFAAKFDVFLMEHKIQPLKIGLCWVNAGTGEFSRFTDTTFAEKQAFLQTNILQYVECADYFSKLFVRERFCLGSGLVFTSSLWAHLMAPYRSLYCVSKAFVSDLAQ